MIKLERILTTLGDYLDVASFQTAYPNCGLVIYPLDEQHDADSAAATMQSTNTDGELRAFISDTFPTHVVFLNDAKGKEEKGITVGRTEGNDLALPEVSVSRHHAVFRRREDGWYITDLGSTNGVFINQVQVQPNQPKGPLANETAIYFGTDVGANFHHPAGLFSALRWLNTIRDGQAYDSRGAKA